MHGAVSVLLAAIVSASPATPVAPAPTARALAELLPAGSHEVEVLEWSASPRYAELVRRYGDAVKRDPRWFQEQRAASRGGPLPYDPRCGLSEAEYRELQAGIGGARLVADRRETLAVRWEGSALRLEGGAQLAPLTAVSMDPTLAVHTPFGTCRGWRAVELELPGAGTLRGHECRAEEVGPSLELVDATRLAVGTLDDGRRLLLYQGSRQWRGATQRHEGLYLRFAAPSPPAIATAAR
jgi:hypothetical protein